jgi:hypothetical protein
MRMLIVVEWASLLGKLLDAPCSKYTVHNWKKIYSESTAVSHESFS